MMQKILKYALAGIALLSLTGGLVYRFYALNFTGIITSLILSLVFLALFIANDRADRSTKSYQKNIILPPGSLRKSGIVNYLLLTSYLALYVFCWLILFEAQTIKSIISPWETVQVYYFAIYAVLTSILILLVISRQKFFLFIVSLHGLLAFGVALAIFPIGYGYDSFVHRATVDLINRIGSVEPKHFYYLGQYSLTVIMSKVLFIPAGLIDRLLVPLMAAIFLPCAFWQLAKKWFADRTKSLLAIVALFVLPVSIFIVTTPQNLSYFFLLIAILIGLNCRSRSDLALLFVIGSAALVTQPIAGIPALLWALAIAIQRSNLHRKRLFLLFILAITALSLPLSFYTLEKTYAPVIDESSVASVAEKSLFTLPVLPSNENIYLNFTYLYEFNKIWIFSFLALTGFFIAWKHRHEDCRLALMSAGMAIALIAAFFLTTFIPFKFLIFYERDDYASRLLTTAVLFLLPLIFISLYAFIDKLLEKNNFVKFSFLIFVSVCAMAALYNSYPRFDSYHNSHGYSVGKADIDAVNWISYNSANEYIVLANQQVSAAALSQSGFAKYYNGNFYYPIPTGSPMYQFYLDMVYKKPSRETMFKAMDAAGVKESYFVLNKYWWAFPKILAEAKLSADSWQEIDNGEVYVFKYKK